MSALDEVIERLHAEIADLKAKVDDWKAACHGSDVLGSRWQERAEKAEAELARRTEWSNAKINELAAALQQSEVDLVQLKAANAMLVRRRETLAAVAAELRGQSCPECGVKPVHKMDCSIGRRGA